MIGHNEGGSDARGEWPFWASACVLLAVICGAIAICWNTSWCIPIRHALYHVTGREFIDRAPACKIEMASIKLAIEEFNGYYGHFPLVSNGADTEVDNGQLIAVLLQKSNNVQFIDLRTNALASGRLLDPWRHPYHIAISSLGIDRVTVGGVAVPGRVAVWSDGPNGTNEYGRGDDVKTW